jgi:CheY-like chemotaxis protein
MASKRVLVVDDDPMIVRGLTVRCKELGLEVHGTSDGLQALLLLRKQAADLLILDLNLPVADGLTVCERVVSDPRLPPLPVIILTGRSDPATVRRCQALGAHYVVKGQNTWERLKPILCRLLQIVSPRAPGAESPECPAPLRSGAGAAQDPPTVLVIDDDPAIPKVLGIKLAAYGVQVRAAVSGMQGFWIAVSELPDVIITDFLMPEGQGDYVVRRLKDHYLTRDIPVIVLTGRTVGGQKDFSLERKMNSLGVRCVLTKPLAFDALLTELRNHIDLPDRPRVPDDVRAPRARNCIVLAGSC